MVKAILTKPLDGEPEGTEREFNQADFDRLERLGAVTAAPAEKAPEEKKEPAPSNKRAPAPKNKAAE
ncbi:hypothetical protein TomMM35A_18560 [Sphingobium sp. TomMM35A]